MSNPFNFIIGILFITVGIPVICNTIVTLIYGPKELRKDRKGRGGSYIHNKKENQMLEEVYYGLKDLGKRVQNLETILDDEGE